MLGVLSLEKFCEKERIVNSDLKDFISKMMELLSTENIPQWNEELNQINISGLGDPLPSKLLEDFPNYEKKLDQITQNLREISAAQIFGKWIPENSYLPLKKLQKLSGIRISKEYDLELFKKHNPEPEGWGDPVSLELIEKWKRTNP